jgi:hypothetical protein
MNRPPHILVLHTDQHRFDCLAYFRSRMAEPFERSP